MRPRDSLKPFLREMRFEHFGGECSGFAQYMCWSEHQFISILWVLLNGSGRDVRKQKVLEM
jgi:hypothetical protein